MEGVENERLYDYLGWHVYAREERIKLAFACLMTSIGIPMILAGDEFGDTSDLKTSHPEKQMDAVNYERMNDEWRKRLFKYVARLVRLRTCYPALGTNEIDFFHVDFNEGKRVMVWRRGFKDSESQVVVVANFSDWGTADPRNPHSEYFVPNWPATPSGKSWHEVTQNRDVPDKWVGREPLYPWQAKVYQLIEKH